MATASRLKTVDGKYYATEEYVQKSINENIEESVVSGEIGDALSGILSEKINPQLENLQSNVNNMEEKIINFLSMNTI